MTAQLGLSLYDQLGPSRALAGKTDPRTVVSWPGGAALRLEDGTSLGLTPCRVEPRENETSHRFSQGLSVARPGYLTRQLSAEAVNNTPVVVLEKGWPLWFLWHLPGLLGLAFLPAALAKVGDVRERLDAAEQVRTQEMVRAQTFQPGREIGPYRLEQHLGKGATAEVFRAVRGGEVVALKILHPAISEHPDSRKRFLREVQICRGLSHPGLVGVLEHGEVDGRLWMAQQFIEGHPLDEVEFPLSEDKVVWLLTRICEGLAYAHQQGVVHRDLKPANILIGPGGHPTIADFGLARGQHYETITKTDTTLGTPAYMPPEQVMGEPTDERSDIYALGCIAYEMLSGHPPFEESEVLQVLMAQINRIPAPLSVSPGLQAVVQRMLAKAPSQRYASVTEVRAALLASSTSSA